MLSKPELLNVLKVRAAELGLTLQDADADALSGSVEAIKAKWFLGGRKVSYAMTCRLAEADHAVHFREAVSERSWGIPPPSLQMETTAVKGWQRSGRRTEHAIGGGGAIDFAKVREEMKSTVLRAGWRFHLEGGRMP